MYLERNSQRIRILFQTSCADTTLTNTRLAANWGPCHQLTDISLNQHSSIMHCTLRSVRATALSQGGRRCCRSRRTVRVAALWGGGGNFDKQAGIDAQWQAQQERLAERRAKKAAFDKGTEEQKRAAAGKPAAKAAAAKPAARKAPVATDTRRGKKQEYEVGEEPEEELSADNPLGFFRKLFGGRERE